MDTGKEFPSISDPCHCLFLPLLRSNCLSGEEKLITRDSAINSILSPLSCRRQSAQDGVEQVVDSALVDLDHAHAHDHLRLHLLLL